MVLESLIFNFKSPWRAILNNVTWNSYPIVFSGNGNTSQLFNKAAHEKF